MENDNSLQERLIVNDEKKVGFSNQLTVEYFSDIFDLDNIYHHDTAAQAYKTLGKQGLLTGLNINEKRGLDSSNLDDLVNRQKVFGTNKRKLFDEKPYFTIVMDCLEDPMLQILCLASIISTIIGVLQEGFQTGWIEGFSIFLAIFVVVSISSYQEYSKQEQFKKLTEENAKKNVNVVRDGIEKKEINIDDLVVGDILHISIGDIAPVDGIIIKDSVTIDESSLTGESELKVKHYLPEKWNQTNNNAFVISGTQIVDGSGKMIVCAVGDNSFLGKQQAMMGEEVDETPLQIKLNDMANKIGDIATVVAIFIGVVLILKDCFLRFASGDSIISGALIDSCINAFIICITVLVVAIPEGLPMAVTISLAFSVFKMKEEHNLVRHLDASETMGNVNNVCTDKTGTLTYGIMSLRRFMLDGREHNLDNNNEKLPLGDESMNLLIESITNNISAYPEKNNEGKLEAKGNFTECALLNFLINNEISPEEGKYESFVRQLPFNSEYKFMATLVELKKGTYRLFVKGAPDRLLGKCTKIRVDNGKEEDLSRHKAALLDQQEAWASKSMRTLVSAYKDFTDKKIESDDSDGLEFFNPILTDLTVLSVFGLADAPREEVPGAIRNCQKAGVMVRMVTGDHIRTAIAISHDVGILDQKEANDAFNKLKEKEGKVEVDKFAKVKGFVALEGEEFRKMSGGYKKIEEENTEEGEKKEKKYRYELADVDSFKKTTENLKVIARASPDDKFLLVLGLKQIGNIVAVTGDGTNDAQALKKSDVGFAMGKRGTDIAKNASDIILLDDSFNSIVTAIKYGRNVYDCIRKFLQFQLTCNVVAVFMTLLGGVILSDSPLNSIQMLWVNLIMDSFASLALATEPPNDKLLERKPYPKDTDIITDTMKINIGTQSIFQIIILIWIIFNGDLLFGVPSDRELKHSVWNNTNGYHFTIFFNIFVMLQVFNSVNARKLLRSEINIFQGIFNNGYYIFIQLIIIGGQMLMVTFGGRALRTHPLTLKQHLGCIAIASLSLVVGILVRLLPIGIDEHIEEKRPNIRQTIRGDRSSVLSKVKSSRTIKSQV